MLIGELDRLDEGTLDNVYDYNEEMGQRIIFDSDNCGDVSMVDLAAILEEKFALDVPEFRESPQLLDFEAEQLRLTSLFAIAREVAHLHVRVTAALNP